MGPPPPPNMQIRNLGRTPKKGIKKSWQEENKENLEAQANFNATTGGRLVSGSMQREIHKALGLPTDFPIGLQY